MNQIYRTLGREKSLFDALKKRRLNSIVRKNEETYSKYKPLLEGSYLDSRIDLFGLENLYPEKLSRE